MSLAGYIVLGIIILILLLFYLLVVLLYYCCSKAYREGDRAKATIVEDLGDMKLATGTVTMCKPRFRTFHKYKVSFWVEGKEYTEEASLKNRKLKIGDSVEIRYEISKKGELSLVSEAYLCWLREMAIGYTLGIILGVVLCIFR